MPIRTPAEQQERADGALQEEEDAVARLVRAAASGSEAAWEALVAEFGRVVLAVARRHRLSEADAADVAQTTWLRLLEHLDQLHDPCRVGAWLATTARRECLRVLRTAQRQTPTDELPELGGDDDIATNLLRHERDAALRLAFRRLQERDQVLLGMLMADSAPSYEQIGAVLQMPVGSIGPTRARSLTRLRREAELVGLTAEPVCV